MDIKYVDIMTGEKLLSIWVANMYIIYDQFLHPEGGECVYRYFSPQRISLY